MLYVVNGRSDPGPNPMGRYPISRNRELLWSPNGSPRHE
jgi:hypothetical protein